MPRRDRRVEEAGAVQVKFQSQRPAGLADGEELVQGPDRAAAHVVGVFHPKERRAAVDGKVRADGLFYLLCREKAPPARDRAQVDSGDRSEEHTSELQSREKLVCRLLLEKKKTTA